MKRYATVMTVKELGVTTGNARSHRHPVLSPNETKGMIVKTAFAERGGKESLRQTCIYQAMQSWLQEVTEIVCVLECHSRAVCLLRQRCFSGAGDMVAASLSKCNCFQTFLPWSCHLLRLKGILGTWSGSL